MISVVIPVFRNATSAVELAVAMRQQHLPPGCPLELVVVDDGSNDGSADLLRQHGDGMFRLEVLPNNQGRSVARNTGANLARGKFLVFIDCDCRPTSSRFLAAHLQLLQGACIASCGPVTGAGDGFWSRYQDEASQRRARQHSRGSVFAGSTQNFAVHTAAFRQVGGFDARYTGYGFEDRDLFVRLSQLGELQWCTDGTVTHLDRLTLAEVLAKMTRAAGASALRFAQDHPEAYRALGYAAIDARLAPWLRPVDRLLAPALHLVPAIDRLLADSRLPYVFAKTIVKLFVALAYLHGSARCPPEKAAPAGQTL